MGSKDKFWFAGEPRWLFKFARSGAGASTRGEDWAECVTHVVAQLLGLPSACVTLASCEFARGVAVRSVLGPEEELVHGNELLGYAVDAYERDLGRHNPKYTVENIQFALNEYSGPPPYTCWRAFDVLAGYLMMDALVAGRDRHHENWGVIRGGKHGGQLAPSFDHGNALGFAEPVTNVEVLLREDRKLDAWLEKGRSEHFVGQPTLIEIAVRALRLSAKASSGYFVERLRALSLDDVAAAVDPMPEAVMSDPHRKFALKVVCRNRRRLLDAFRACGVSP